jgi:O-antigen/teichoic acid export membrane protein
LGSLRAEARCGCDQAQTAGLRFGRGSRGRVSVVFVDDQASQQEELSRMHEDDEAAKHGVDSLHQPDDPSGATPLSFGGPSRRRPPYGVQSMTVPRIGPLRGLWTLRLFQNAQLVSIFVGITDQGLMSTYNFVVNIFLTRWFGLEIFGVFTTIFLVYLVGFVVCRSSVVSPSYAIFHEESQGIRAYDFFLKAYTGIFSFIIAAFGVIVVHLLLQNSPSSIPVGNLSIFLFVFMLLAQGTFRYLHFGAGRSFLGIGLDLLQVVLGGGGLLILSWLSIASINLCVGVLAFAAGVPLVISLIRGGFAPPAPDVALAFHQRHWLSSRWLLPANLMATGYEYSFTLGAGVIFGAEALAVLRIVQQIFSFAIVPIQSFESFLPRYFARRYREIDRTEYIALTFKISALIVAVFAGLSGSIYGLSGWLSGALFHLDLSGARTMTSLFALAVPLMAVRGALTASLRACEHTRPNFNASVVTTILAALSIVPLLYTLKVDGAVAGILLIESASVFLLARGVTGIPASKAADKTSPDAIAC